MLCIQCGYEPCECHERRYGDDDRDQYRAEADLEAQDQAESERAYHMSDPMLDFEGDDMDDQ